MEQQLISRILNWLINTLGIIRVRGLQLYNSSSGTWCRLSVNETLKTPRAP